MRAYQIACWQGYFSPHEFFLGRSLRGWVILIYATASAESFFFNWLLGLCIVLGVVGIDLLSILAIALTDPEEGPYGQL